jgi:cytochrome c peroxidase
MRSLLTFLLPKPGRHAGFLASSLGLWVAASAWAGHPGAPPPELAFSHPRGNSVAVTFSTLAGGKTLILDRPVKIANDTVTINRLAYFVSNVEWVDRAGKAHALADQVLLVDAARGRVTGILNHSPDGDYRAIRFTIGLPPAINHADPAHYPAGHPLHPLTSGLHWGWQGGYVFLAIEGHVTRQDQPPAGLMVHQGGSHRAVVVEAPIELRLPGQPVLHVSLDLGALLTGKGGILTRPDQRWTTHGRVGDALADWLATAVPRVVQVHAMATVRQDLPRPSRAQGALKQTPLRAASTSAKPYVWQQPAHFPLPTIPVDNPLTEAGVALGKLLFHEPRLAQKQRQSCATCHQATAAFVDQGNAISRGESGQVGVRNTMPLFNLAWQTRFGWDGRLSRLRDQALAPITDSREMNHTLDGAVSRLKEVPQYRQRFKATFGEATITSERIGLALEQYLLTLVSADSRFDRYLQGRLELTPAEARGLALFNGEFDPQLGQRGADCFHCHGGNLLSTFELRNNGLVDRPADRGHEAVTTHARDRNRFKTPSLRNVAVTGPYMHDGRLATLADVLDHYSEHVQASATLDPALAKHNRQSLLLTAREKADLIAFLEALTDPAFARRPHHEGLTQSVSAAPAKTGTGSAVTSRSTRSRQ